jgi:glycosyltransferase involved in cell wall biosynthesis
VQLRILHLLTSTEAGGLSRYVHDLALASIRRGHEALVAGDSGAWQGLFDDSDVPFMRIPLNGGPVCFLRCAHRLRTWMKPSPPQVIHTHYRKATLLARRLQRKGTPPILYTLHLSHMPARGLRRWLTDFGDHTHVAAAQARQWLMDESLVRADRITLIPHGINVDSYPQRDHATALSARHALGFAPEDLLVAYVGRMDWPKNEAWMLDLAERTRQTLPRLRVLMAGDGPNAAALHRAIEARNLGDRVRMLGHRDPLPIYQAIDALLLPSQREGFSLVCAEAMSVGVPCLRTHTSGSEELIVPDVTGRSTPIDREAFVMAATEFLSDRDRLWRMGQAAAAHIRAHFTYDRQVDQTLDLYRRLATLCPRG